MPNGTLDPGPASGAHLKSEQELVQAFRAVLPQGPREARPFGPHEAQHLEAGSPLSCPMPAVTACQGGAVAAWSTCGGLLPGDEVHLCLRTLQICTDCVSGALDLPHLAASGG